MTEAAVNCSLLAGRKRRASSEDEIMGEPSEDDYREDARHKTEHNAKRTRPAASKPYPLDKLLATMDKEKLIELIQDLVDANPPLQNEIGDLISAHSLKSDTIS